MSLTQKKKHKSNHPIQLARQYITLGVFSSQLAFIAQTSLRARCLQPFADFRVEKMNSEWRPGNYQQWQRRRQKMSSGRQCDTWQSRCWFTSGTKLLVKFHGRLTRIWKKTYCFSKQFSGNQELFNCLDSLLLFLRKIKLTIDLVMFIIKPNQNLTEMLKFS